MVYLKIIHLKDQLWTVIARLLSVLLLADPFYSPDFNIKNVECENEHYLIKNATTAYFLCKLVQKTLDWYIIT